MVNRIFCILFFIFIVCLWGGCATRPVAITTDESIIGSQISVTKLEASDERSRELLRLYDEFFRSTTQLYDDFIRNATERTLTGIDDALFALDGYDAFVQELIRRIRQLESAIREREGKGEDP